MPTELMLNKSTVANNLVDVKQLNVYTSLSGRYKYNFITPPRAAAPQILLVEKYRLSSFLDRYGAGRTIKTYSLLPGERTSISMRSYRNEKQSAVEASSILDSYTEESAESFEDAVMQEDSATDQQEKSFEYHAEAEANASWGWGSASVSGGVSGGTNATREEFAKNVSNATQKHASSASAKRDVQINTNSEVSAESGEETSITREIQNINVSRTLNFTFRQMNQEFVTLLHLVDVRVAFFKWLR